MSETSTLSVKPIIHYPRETQVGKNYLMTINLEPEKGFDWQYDEEDYPIYCTVESNLFCNRPIGEPVITLHRFGGSYGEAKFLIKAESNNQDNRALIEVKLSNKYGVSLKRIKIEDISISLVNNAQEVELIQDEETSTSLSSKNKISVNEDIYSLEDETNPDDSSGNVASYSSIKNSEQSQISKMVKPLNEAKLVFVGQGNVGKTSLINRLLDDRFNLHQSQTGGLTVREWSVHFNRKDVRLNVWDFGGQEIYHATHQFFLTKRSLYILVCNCRTSEEENRLEYWLKLIASFGGESPMIIVGNKNDEQPFDINFRALQDKYPNVKAILETSCRTSDGIEYLRQAIIHEVRQLKEVYDLLPISWFNVKETLENLDKDFISYQSYTTICASEDIIKEQDQKQLIGLLHDLGLVLNFGDHPLLQNTNVLNPAWVTTGIYALFSDDQLKTDSKGILTSADLRRILDPDRYPPERHIYLTELMKEFQLCLPLSDGPPDCPEQLLLPGLLPKEQPDDTDLDGATLEFQYHYRILPQSIISRFICLMHEKIHEKIYWRSGVMLAYQEHGEVYNLARILADIEDKKIFIAISGRAPTRRIFLALIRDTFTKIHSSFADPGITEWVPVPDHPNHPPLDYQELLGMERMAMLEYPIGRLGICINIRQLLDGYEPREVRQLRYHGKDDLDMMDIEGKRRRWKPETRHLQDTTIANLVNEVKGNAHQQTKQHIHQASSQSLAEAAKEIQALLEQLDHTYDHTSPISRMEMVVEVMKSVDKNPSLKACVLNALRAGGTTALEEVISHPAVQPVVAALKGFIDAN